MVLDMPSLFGVFKESSTTGEGLGSSIVQQTITQAFANGCIQVVGTTDAHITIIVVFEDVPEMTYTFLNEGLYLVIFTMAVNINSGAGAGQCYVKLLHNAVNLGGATAEESAPCDNSSVITIPALITVAAGDVVKAQWRTGGVGDNAYCNVATLPEQFHRKLIFVRLGA